MGSVNIRCGFLRTAPFRSKMSTAGLNSQKRCLPISVNRSPRKASTTASGTHGRKPLLLNLTLIREERTLFPNISVPQALDVYDDLVKAYYGENGYGGNVAEIYCYRLLPRNPTAEAAWQNGVQH